MLDQARALLTAKGHKNLTHLSHHEVTRKGKVVAHLFRLARNGQGSLRWQGVVNEQGELVGLEPITTSERKQVKRLGHVRRPEKPTPIEGFVSKDQGWGVAEKPVVVQRRGQMPRA